MQIRSLTPISFKAHYTNVDIGASSILGSLKIAAVDEKTGKVIAKDRTTVFDQGEKRSEGRFEAKVAARVADFETKNKKKIEKFDKEDKVKLTVCYPGPSVRMSDGSTGFMMSNFFYDDSRQERFKRPISIEAIDDKVWCEGVKLEQSRHANDMGGAGASLLNSLQRLFPEVLEEGQEIMYLYPGGGLGSGMISVEKDGYRIRPMELQHIVKYGTENDSDEKDVGAAGLRRNFAEALGIDPKEIGENTKVVDNYDELCKTLGYKVDRQDFEMASKTAISKFMDSLAQMIAIKVCEAKLQTVIITGPVANSLKNSVNNNSYFTVKDNRYYETDPEIREPKFDAILKEKVQENLTDVGKKILGNPDNLNIIFLENKDNTEGAHLLQKGESVGKPIAWYNIKK